MIGFLPGVPTVELDPDVVLLIFLPPLLYGAAFFTSVRELRRDARSIATLAIPLVFATMAAVAVVAHEVVGLEWSESFVLGAIVSPTDAVAPAEIMRRVGAPRRLLAIIEGESLTNDWTALVLYRVAVAAVVSAVLHALGGGARVHRERDRRPGRGPRRRLVIRQVRSRMDDPPIEITISILSGYVGYLPAEALGFSGVVAAVTTGLYMAWYTPQLTTPVLRLQTLAVWEILTFLLNALLFLLVGLQLPGIIDDLQARAGELAALGRARERGRDRRADGLGAHAAAGPAEGRPAGVAASAADRLAGPRGARLGRYARLGVARGRARHPAATDSGDPFPERDLIIFLAFMVILVTLIGQGLTLGPVVHALDVDDGTEEQEDTLARRRVAEAALERLDELGEPDWISAESVGRARQLYDYRERRFGALEEGAARTSRIAPMHGGG